jgi:hypothetical protein
VNDLLVSVDEKDVATVLAFLDESAAFDLVDHHIFIDRLSSRFGFCGLTLVWFQSYLSNRSQYVSRSGHFSSPVLLPSGVPQCFVLGPILYNLYTTPIHDISVSHGVPDHQYADRSEIFIVSDLC